MISNKATVTSLKYKQGVKTNIVTTHELTCLQGATVTRLTLTRQMTCQEGFEGLAHYTDPLCVSVECHMSTRCPMDIRWLGVKLNTDEGTKCDAHNTRPTVRLMFQRPRGNSTKTCTAL